MALSWEKVFARLQLATAGNARLVLGNTVLFFLHKSVDQSVPLVDQKGPVKSELMLYIYILATRKKSHSYLYIYSPPTLSSTIHVPLLHSLLGLIPGDPPPPPPLYSLQIWGLRFTRCFLADGAAAREAALTLFCHFNIYLVFICSAFLDF